MDADATPLTQVRTLSRLLKAHAGPAVAGVSRGRGRLRRHDQTRLEHPASAYFPALSFLCDRRNRRETTLLYALEAEKRIGGS
jgi:hypothetical protein